MMKAIGVFASALFLAAAACMPTLAEVSDDTRAERLRSVLTIVGAGTGLAAGAAIGIAFSSDAIGTPLSDALLLTLPVAAVGTATGALAGYWIADVVLRHPPKPLFAIIEGGGLGAAAGAFIGALTFAANLAIGYHVLEVPDGYWGEPPIPMLGMALVAGGFWGGAFGMVAGAIVLPMISLIMGY